MFFEKDYDLLPRTYAVKSYRRKDSKVLKSLTGICIFLLFLSVAALVFVLFLMK